MSDSLLNGLRVITLTSNSWPLSENMLTIIAQYFSSVSVEFRNDSVSLALGNNRAIDKEVFPSCISCQLIGKRGGVINYRLNLSTAPNRLFLCS